MAHARRHKPQGFWSVLSRSNPALMGGSLLQKPIRKGKTKKRKTCFRKKRGSYGDERRFTGNSQSPKGATEKDTEGKHDEIRGLCGQVKDTAGKLIEALDK